MKTDSYHIPVMLQQCIEGLNINPNGTYVDATFGGGGHSRAILERLQNGRLIAFDKDADALPNVPDDERFTLVNHDFSYLKNFLRYFDALPVDGILADLGISSHQVDEGARGFSFKQEAKLDMRMDQDLTTSAYHIINEWKAEELQRVFSMYGEIKNAKTLAQAIVEERASSQIETTTQLAAIAEKQMPKKLKASKYLAMLFQALRIAVNKELDALHALLEQSVEVLAPGGRLVIMSYHSLEDRPVKNFIASGNFQGKLQKDLYGNIERPLEPVHKKPVEADEAEIERNPRARSAKLRIAEKKAA